MDFTLFIFILISTIISAQERRIARSEPEGDLIIGALFPVHKGPKDITGYTRTCGDVWEQYGIHRIEIFLRTLEQINNDTSILPNITLGYDIRDSCWYSPICLEQSIDFIKDSIASLDDSFFNSTVNDGCKKENRKPIVGLIGPGTSSNTIQVQNLLQIFKLPQIGYSATSMDLSDKNLYKYFLRVVPSDKYQAQALLDIVLRYNWTYISAVYTDGSYGAGGMDTFIKLAEQRDVCVAKKVKISKFASDEKHVDLVNTLMEKMKAKVIVCFCDGETVKALYNATSRVPGAKGHFLIVGSDGWNDRPDVVLGNEDNVAGGMSIKLTSPKIPDFDDFFLNLNPYTNKRNPWFTEFWEQKYNCYVKGSENENKNKNICTGKEALKHKDEFVQDSKLGFVINAVYTMAHALHNMQLDVCGEYAGICSAMTPVKGELYLDYLKNVSLTTYSNYELKFDENGDPPARYDIMNFQRFMDEFGNVSYGYVRVGQWQDGSLSMNDSIIYWPRNSRNIVPSVCSEPCAKGFVKNVDDQTKCCWTCHPCKENEVMLDETTCKPCDIGWWPNDELTACKEIDIEYLSWLDNEAMVAITLACFGIFATLWIGVIFMRHHNTPVVKASTRELMYIIMLGIIMAYSSNFVLVAKPTMVTCYFSRILPGLSFSLIYGSLVTKTNRIARILEGTKKIITKKPRFMSASAQVIITCILVGIECAIITVMLIIEPSDKMLDYPSVQRVRLICNTTTLGIVVPFGFDLILILMCTLYAIKTRNLPENFNEAKFIGFTMYTTCVIWLGFFAIYFGSEPMVLTLSVSISLSASVALVLLFFPKVYVIVWAPEKNTRSAFTTSKDVRCHVGSVSYPSESGHEFAKGSGFIQRKKFSFGKFKSNKQKSFGARNETASLPPNMKLNRDNSMHIKLQNSQKFPWSKKDNSHSGDDDDRLSTISSKEESRSSSEKRRKHNSMKQDSECQTDIELFENYLFKSNLRKRKTNASRGSNGSINSDEIFLSLPVSDVGENRGMYRLSPRHSDKSPLLGVFESSEKLLHQSDENVETFNNLSDADICNPDMLHTSPVSYHDQLVSACEHDSSRDEAYSPDICSKQYYKNVNTKDESHDIAVENGPLIQLENTYTTCCKPVSPLYLQGSNLYNRRHNPFFNKEKSLDKGRSITPQQHKSIEPSPYLSHDCIKYSSDGICNCAQNKQEIQDFHDRYSNTRSTVNSSSLSCNSNTSIEDMSSFGIQKLEEEEVSMLSFRDYLKNRGVDLDMSSVQSSEV